MYSEEDGKTFHNPMLDVETHPEPELLRRRQATVETPTATPPPPEDAQPSQCHHAAVEGRYSHNRLSHNDEGGIAEQDGGGTTMTMSRTLNVARDTAVQTVKQANAVLMRPLMAVSAPTK